MCLALRKMLPLALKKTRLLLRCITCSHLLLSVLITDTTAALSATVSPYAYHWEQFFHAIAPATCTETIRPLMRKPHTLMTRMHPCMMVAAGGVRTTPDIMPRSFHNGRNVAVRVNSSVQMDCVVHLFDHMESSAARMSCLVSQHSMHAAVGQSGTVARAWYLNASLSPLVNLPLQPCQLLEA